jgi:hypothetical protein
MSMMARKHLAILLLSVIVGIALWFLVFGRVDRPALEMVEEYDLGELGHGDLLQPAVEFRNVGRTTLTIDTTLACCGWEVKRLQKTEYAPGEQGQLDFEWSALGLPGSRFERTFVIRYTNESGSHTHQLRFLGRMAPGLVASPASLTVAGLHVGDTWTRELNVQGAGKAMDYAIESVTSTLEGLSATVEPAEALGGIGQVGVPAKRYKVTVRQSPVTRPGTLAGEIRMDTTHPHFPRLVVPVTVKVDSRLATDPRFLLLTAKRGGHPPARTLTIAAPQPIRVTLAAENGDVECVPQTTGEAPTWRFHCRPRPGIPSTRSGTLTFGIVGCPGESSLAVPYTVVVE